MKLFLWMRLDTPMLIVATSLGDARVQFQEWVVPCGDLPLPDRTYEVDPYSKEEVLLLPSVSHPDSQGESVCLPPGAQKLD